MGASLYFPTSVLLGCGDIEMGVLLGNVGLGCCDGPRVVGCIFGGCSTREPEALKAMATDNLGQLGFAPSSQRYPQPHGARGHLVNSRPFHPAASARWDGPAPDPYFPHAGHATGLGPAVGTET